MSSSAEHSPREAAPRICPIASGKGGVGKSILTANLGIALASQGRRVTIVDLDLGGSNLHSLIGIENTGVGIGGYSSRVFSSIEDIVLETPYPGLKLIAGDSLHPGSANIPWWFKQRLLKELRSLSTDLILIDLGAGSSYNTLDFFLISQSGLLVTTPEPTAMVNGYSFVKNVFFRLLHRLFPARSPERQFIGEWSSRQHQHGEGTSKDIIPALEVRFPGSGSRARSLMESMRFGLVMNDYHSPSEESLWRNLCSAAKKNLGLSLEHLGSLPHDDTVRQSTFNRIPVARSQQDGPFAAALADTADKILQDI